MAPEQGPLGRVMPSAPPPPPISDSSTPPCPPVSTNPFKIDGNKKDNNNSSNLPPEEGDDLLPPMDELVIAAAAKRKLWRKVADEALQAGDLEAAENLGSAFPVFYTPNPQGGAAIAQVTELDWKLLSQLCATVNDSGIQGEPTKQMLNYIWGSNLLLPIECNEIAKLILTPHQQILFIQYWTQLCAQSVATPRQQGNPLHGVTLDELMVQNQFATSEAQGTSGPDKVRESMHLARQAFEKIKTLRLMPSYMSIKQGREEPFGAFVDRLSVAIQSSDAPEGMHAGLLRQCVLQNSNSTTKNIIVTLPGDWTIERLLERMVQVPQGSIAMLVEAIHKLGKDLEEQAKLAQEQAKLFHSQVLAALASTQWLRSCSCQEPLQGLLLSLWKCWPHAT
ncbi:hypothetical protein WISP_79192 [Willisornis vidua]|uniref:Retroviral nucleocapsid Gag protein p24 C-terminal domain-containing protein n=1 Tax=Willisornis vidua TaxID=1566151 RepID=A0ABQ9D5P0_9PASS|nr:hypothetical protein WISP_79192 [Willisornis vidua]